MGSINRLDHNGYSSGNIGWRSKAEIANPKTGDDLFARNSPTHLESDNEFSQGLRAWFSAEF
ncbi:MAG: hypothetical protein L3J65_11310 [Robiginitomaculum sp.]|nr:hypothetical protein [Robiginitomaculum sp.]